MNLSIINPATGEEITKIETDNQLSISHKYEDLKTGQKNWAAVSLEKRIEIIQLFEQLLKKNETNLASILTSEVGKPLQQSINEINGGISRINWLCHDRGNCLR